VSPQPFYRDPFSGLVHEFSELEPGRVVIHTHGDAQEVLDANAFDRNHSNPYTPSRDLKHVARIPVEVYMIWLNELGVDVLNPDHADKVRKLLNDSQWAYLRTSGGRV
jgi:hypothetical protein